ncbi:hypothetical protein J3E71DRAFT_363605 [Bipolaris maydis]|nr:hypothetical protein J3E71DRAFT_363605 [Bipolaris maydis]
MASFSTKISNNRMPNGELSEAQRRPPKLTSRDYHRLLRIVKRELKIEYSALGYYKFRSKRRPFISSPIAKIRHDNTIVKFSDECSIARRSSRNT